ncbi:MAG: hypothetical protein U5L11_17110 [Arhodomonas sp.]|nr:hypothetical protein [Arhodomonas sp.]
MRIAPPAHKGGRPPAHVARQAFGNDGQRISSVVEYQFVGEPIAERHPADAPIQMPSRGNQKRTVGPAPAISPTATMAAKTP